VDERIKIQISKICYSMTVGIKIIFFLIATSRILKNVNEYMLQRHKDSHRQKSSLAIAACF